MANGTPMAIVSMTTAVNIISMLIIFFTYTAGTIKELLHYTILFIDHLNSVGINQMGYIKIIISNKVPKMLGRWDCLVSCGNSSQKINTLYAPGIDQC